jgi:hypothetical protein
MLVYALLAKVVFVLDTLNGVLQHFQAYIASEVMRTCCMSISFSGASCHFACLASKTNKRLSAVVVMIPACGLFSHAKLIRKHGWLQMWLAR